MRNSEWKKQEGTLIIIWAANQTPGLDYSKNKLQTTRLINWKDFHN